MRLLPRRLNSAPPKGTEVIEVSPDQIYQADPRPKRFWELSFDGHVTNMMLASFAIAFVLLAGFAAFIAWSTHLLD